MSVNIHWDILIPGHAWIKMGGNPSFNNRTRMSIRNFPLLKKVMSRLLVTETLETNTIGNTGELSNLTVALPINMLVSALPHFHADSQFF